MSVINAIDSKNLVDQKLTIKAQLEELDGEITLWTNNVCFDLPGKCSVPSGLLM